MKLDSWHTIIIQYNNNNTAEIGKHISDYLVLEESGLKIHYRNTNIHK